tara:strand:+ start:1945 stop:2127 length:183 start_codon:yes stop_codon:yes gene_type:complete
MTKQQEDTMFEIHQKVEQSGLRKRFDKLLKQMAVQDQHKYKDVCERWEYAYSRIEEEYTK